ncbi:3-deoxy-manno-octulosonate cytidylyltransferase [Rhodocytophaga aerolata]|uniref:3-deoxy-manno-octulosonate cytidylyltransferase n=1 Tax=Rhodocytophaga aerolata TaxID=455078 RepID=A0ABT8R973_9BACT|nr:3-deoxy-manno-octulosonate cytidylyltransferase [Rhodocytophaga aerolata]MDO1447909.1 3-deoxy-manno-octulosonate cytidylyltransferase [Rhodocytophaga aerolata]
MTTILGIIPARYASTRFPAKALALINGKTMVQRVYEQALQASALQQVVVATDHQLIYDHIRQIGGQVVMTSPDHPSGTDRCFEALQKSHFSCDYVINIQGDEPFIQPEQINILAECLKDSQTEIATLVKKIEDLQTLLDPNKPKVLLNTRAEAIYFSRQTLPYIRGAEKEHWLEKHTYYKHIGMYAYRTDVLAQLTQLPVSSLEKAEALEQLRWLENGYRIQAAITPYDTMGIDTPEDLQKALAAMQ